MWWHTHVCFCANFFFCGPGFRDRFISVSFRARPPPCHLSLRMRAAIPFGATFRVSHAVEWRPWKSVGCCMANGCRALFHVLILRVFLYFLGRAVIPLDLLAWDYLPRGHAPGGPAFLLRCKCTEQHTRALASDSDASCALALGLRPRPQGADWLDWIDVRKPAQPSFSNHSKRRRFV